MRFKLNLDWLFLLGVVLIILKATKVIDCSWWLIFFPFYVPVFISIVVVVLFLISIFYPGS